MRYRSKFFKITVGIILILLIAYLLIQLKPLLSSFLEFLEIILLPIIIAGGLYYFLRPLRDYLEKNIKIPRILIIPFIYLMIMLFIIFLIAFIWPKINEQINQFANMPSRKIKEVETKTIDIMNFFNFTPFTEDQLRETLKSYLIKVFTLISNNLIFTLSSIAQIASYFIITPFILFYLLRDDENMKKSIIYWTSEMGKKRVGKILSDIDSTLSAFITGQVLVALAVGALIFLGYTIIGLNYAFLLAFFAFVFNLIPFCGPFISTIPALIIGLSVGPEMCFKVILVVLLVHLLDLNLISPRIVGSRLNIHPITIILLLVLSLFTFGILGMFIITPLYAVIKVVIHEIYGVEFSVEKKIEE